MFHLSDVVERIFTKDLTRRLIVLAFVAESSTITVKKACPLHTTNHSAREHYISVSSLHSHYIRRHSGDIFLENCVYYSIDTHSMAIKQTIINVSSR